MHIYIHKLRSVEYRIHQIFAAQRLVLQQTVRKISLFPAGFAAKARAVGNAAGAGAAMVLLSDPIRREAEGMPAAVRTVALSSHPGFMDAYIDGMYFA